MVGNYQGRAIHEAITYIYVVSNKIVMKEAVSQDVFLY